VFVPVDADAGIVDRLRRLGSDVVPCPREPGVAGDPAYLRLREELAAGAVPFTCQGNENGLAIEGGQTIAYELATQLAGTPVDHIVIQVGGGALASACAAGLREAAELGAIGREPRLHTVQTTGAHPLERAYERVRALLPGGDQAGRGAARLWRRDHVERALATATRHRSDYMWPWESEPRSIATGILDDETYDWRAVTGAMLTTGGRPLVVSEDRLAEANELGAAAGFQVDTTGSAGLAGALDLRRDGVIGADERVTVLFTGVRRLPHPERVDEAGATLPGGGADRDRGDCHRGADPGQAADDVAEYANPPEVGVAERVRRFGVVAGHLDGRERVQGAVGRQLDDLRRAPAGGAQRPRREEHS
jgi:threonine synthase